jgi:hypothetical protein
MPSSVFARQLGQVIFAVLTGLQSWEEVALDRWSQAPGSPAAGQLSSEAQSMIAAGSSTA